MPDLGRVAVADSFRRILLQPNNVTISADDVDDALTLVAGNFMQFVPNEAGDEITINAASTISASFDGGDVALITNFLSTQAATSTTNGAVRIYGGLGVGGAIYASSIQNTPIGSSTKATGGFTSLTAVGTTTLEGTVNINGLDVSTSITPLGIGTVTIGPNTAGTINKMSIGATTRDSGAFTTLAANSTTTLTGAVDINGSNVNIVISPTGTGTVTIQPAGGLTVNPATLGTINNASIGASTRSTGAFTTLAANSATTLTANTASTTTGTGALIVSGGVGIGGALNVGGALNIGGNSVLGTTGSNVGIGGTASVIQGTGKPGTYLDVKGFLQLRPLGSNGNIDFASFNDYRLVNLEGGQAGAEGGPYFNINISNSTSSSSVNTVARFNSADTTSTSTTTGALTVVGGVGVSGNVNIGGSTNTVGITSTSTVSLSPASANVTISPTGTGTVTVNPVAGLTINPTAVGTINNTSIGASTRSTGAFTTIGANSTVSFDTTTNNQSYTNTGAGIITIDSGTTGSINNMTIGAVEEATGRFTTITSTVAQGTAPLTVTSTTVVANLQAATAAKWHTSRTLTLSGYVAGSGSIDGSGDVSIFTTAAVDAVTLGSGTIGQYTSTIAVSGNGITATTPNAEDGTAYTITSNATSANTPGTVVYREAVTGNFSAGTISAAISASTIAATGTVTFNQANANISMQPSGTGTVTIKPATVGALDNVIVGATGAVAGTFTTLTSTNNTSFNGANITVEIKPTGTGTVAIRPNSVGAIDNVNIGANVPWIGAFTQLTTSSTVNMAGNGSVITLNPSGSGTVTINPATLGSINKMSIGASTRSTGAFTTLTADDSVTFNQGTAATSKTSGTLIVTGGVGVSGDIHSTSINASSNIITPLLTMQGDIQLQNGRLISQRVQLTFDQPSVDIELASYIAQTVLGYSFVKVSAMGIYVNNPAAPTVFARVHKSWVQGIWNNGTTYQIDGAALEQGAFNSDSTNFPAGAVNAGSALIVATTGSVKLRFLNRVSPSTGSTTTWVYTIEIMNT
jgi:hypothetical protein